MNQTRPVPDPGPSVPAVGHYYPGVNNAGTHDLFAVFVKGRLDEQRSQSEAQSVVSVPDTSLPAGGAGLKQTTTSYNQVEPVSPIGNSTGVASWVPKPVPELLLLLPFRIKKR